MDNLNNTNSRYPTPPCDINAFIHFLESAFNAEVIEVKGEIVKTEIEHNEKDKYYNG